MYGLAIPPRTADVDGETLPVGSATRHEVCVALGEQDHIARHELDLLPADHAAVTAAGRDDVI